MANQSGEVVVSNSDPDVPGQQKVGAMMKTIIAKGNPPVPPVPLTKNELKQIRNVVIGRTGTSSRAGPKGKPLIEQEEKEEEETEAEGTKAEGTEEKAEVVADAGDDTTVTDVSVARDAADFNTGAATGGLGASFTDTFMQDAAGLGTAADFAPVNNPFDTSFLSSCGP